MSNQTKILSLLFLLFSSTVLHAQPRQGMPAEEIALPSVDGDTIRLSSFKGKVVLLDFWASWCGPCRASNKAFTKLYPKYKDKDFVILSVSLDENSEAWKKAITKDKVTWPQVIDRGGWEANTARKWNIYALPTTYLIDKEGKLIAMDLEKKELDAALKQLLN
jgi:peroxiredoxin